jgi:Stress responsive A/B Barrel Domain
MVTHIVIFTWIAGVTGEQVAAFGGALDDVAAIFADSAVIRHGPDLAFRGGNGDYALVAEFADQAAWTAYQADPRHQAFVRDVVTPIQANRLTIQF